MKEGGFDAAFLAVGAHIAKRAFIPAKDSARILDAVAVLRSMEGEEQPMLGRRVVVYGGGNTAIDVARTAKRLGATEAVIVYRRTRERMPAHDFEVEEALEEGVLVKWLSTIKQAGDGDADDREDGARREGQSRSRPASFETLEADSLVLALGQDVDLSLLDGVPGLEIDDGVVQVDPATMMTGHAGLFAGGDMVPAERNVTVGDRPRQEGRAPHRRLAARHAARAGAQARAWRPSSAQPLVLQRRAARPCARSSTSPAARAASTRCRAASTEDNALFEARRCLSAAATASSATTATACAPTTRSIKLGPGKRFEFNYDYCKGCGVCVAECPCGAIEMVPEAA